MIDSEIEMKELSRKHPTNTHNKRLLIQISQECHRHCAAERNHHVEEYKHTHKHTHTHTHTHTHAPSISWCFILHSSAWFTISLINKFPNFQSKLSQAEGP